MQIEEYFEFDNPNGIRVRGTRINIEVVVRETRDGLSPDEIVQDYPSLTLEQVHAALAYYHHNKSSMDEYMERQHQAYLEAKRKHEAGEQPEVVQRLHKLKT